MQSKRDKQVKALEKLEKEFSLLFSEHEILVQRNREMGFDY